MSSVFILNYHFSIKQFLRTDKHHKNLITALIKTMPPGSFKVLKIPSVKEKCGECKRNAINKWIF